MYQVLINNSQATAILREHIFNDKSIKFFNYYYKDKTGSLSQMVQFQVEKNRYVLYADHTQKPIGPNYFTHLKQQGYTLMGGVFVDRKEWRGAWGISYLDQCVYFPPDGDILDEEHPLGTDWELVFKEHSPIGIIAEFTMLLDHFKIEQNFTETPKPKRLEQLLR